MNVFNWKNKLDCHATMLANYICCIILVSVEVGLIKGITVKVEFGIDENNDLPKQKLDVCNCPVRWYTVVHEMSVDEVS